MGVLPHGETIRRLRAVFRPGGHLGRSHEVNADPVKCESAELAVVYARSAIMELSGPDVPPTVFRVMAETKGDGKEGPRHRSISRQKGSRIFRSAHGRY